MLRSYLKALVLYLLASTVAYPQAFPNQPDNILTAAGSVGLPPGVSTEGDSEIINLPNGSVNLFIPAITLPQRSGVKPLILGFTYNSHVIGYRQDVYVDIGLTTAQGTDESNPSYYYAGSNSNTPYDMYNYSEQTIWNAPFIGGLQPTIPILTASVEYEGDAWEVTPSIDSRGGNTGGSYNIIPQMCVTNFTFTDWDGNTHPFDNISNCVEGYPGYYNQASQTASGSILMQSMDAADNSLYHLDTSNSADIQVTDPDGSVYHFTHFRTTYPVFPLSAITGGPQNRPPPQGSSSSEGILEGPTSIVDRNGNTMNISGDVDAGFTIVDTLGRQIKVSGSEIDYTDSNGNAQNVTLSTDRVWQSSTPDVGVPVNQSAPCQVVAGQFNPPVAQYYVSPYIADQIVVSGQHELQSLTYSGTNRKFQFELDSNYQLVKIIYPSGGYTRYDYSATTYLSTNGPIECVWASPRVAHRYKCPSATSDGSKCNVTEFPTTYNYGEYNTTSFATQNCPFGRYYGYPLANYVTVIDLFGTSTVHCFNAAPSATLGPQESDTFTLDSGGNQLSHKQNTFVSAPTADSGGSSVPFPFPSSITTTVTTSTGNVSSTIQRTYDAIGQTVDGGGYAYNQYNGAQVITPIYNVTDQKDYGFDGTLINHKSTSYWYSGHILDKPQLKTEYDPVTGVSRSIENVYDGQGNITSITESGTNLPSATTTFTLDSYGRPLTSTNQLGQETKFGYSDNYIPTTGSIACTPPSSAAPNALLTSVTNALNQTINYGYYYCSGLVGSIADPNTNQITYGYDTLGRLVTVSYPDRGNESTIYNDLPPNTITSTRRAAPDVDEQTQTILDGFSRKSIATDGAGDSVQTTYDGIGRVSAISNPYTSSPTNWTSYQYDSLDRTIMVIDPDGSKSVWCYNGQASSTPANCAPNQSAVAAAELWVDFTDQAQHHRQQSLDANTRLIQVTEPDAQSGDLAESTIYTYDGFDDLLSVQQAAYGTNPARIRSFTYDSFSRLLTSTNPEAGIVCYGSTGDQPATVSNCTSGYDANNNLKYKTDARGLTTSYRYDALNRLIQKTIPMVTSSTSVANGSISTCYQYDALNGASPSANLIGRLTAEWTQSGTQCASAYTPSAVLTAKLIESYDPMGRPLLSQQCITTTCQNWPFVQSESYDLAGNMTSWLDGRGLMMFTQHFDGAGRPISVTNSFFGDGFPSVLFSAQSYSPSGAIQNWNIGDYMNITRTFDNRSRVSAESVTH